MSVNNVIDPSDLFRELSGGGGGEGVSPAEVNRLADQLTATTDNIRTLISRQQAQRAQAARQLDTPPPSSSAGDELEDIAKQIADHAETLYQTWKARGLAPADVLKSHNTTSLNSEAAQTLSRHLREGGSRASTPSCRTPTPSPAGRAAAAPSSQPSPSSPQPLEHTIPIRLERGGAQPRVNGADSPTAERRQPPADRWKPQQQQPHQQQQQQQPQQQQYQSQQHQQQQQQQFISQQQTNQQHVQKPAPQQQQQPQPHSPNAVQHQQHSPPLSQQQQQAAGQARREPTAHGRAAPPPDRWKPQPQQQQRGAISPADLLASPDSDRSLEELVKNFVQEDKARRGGPSSPSSPPAGYQTLPARPGEQRAYRGAKTAPNLLNSRLQVSTNGERRVLEAGDEPDSSTATWPLKARARPADQPRTALPEQTAGPAASSAAAAAAEAERAADAALAEVRQQEEQLRSALQSGSLIAPRRDLSPRPDGLAMSTVDYAKLRFQDPQQRSRAAQRLEDSRSMARGAGATGAQVTEARSRYDNGQINISDSQWRAEWLPGRYAVDPDSGVLMPPESWRRKRALQKAAAAAGDAPRTVSPLPHPQLTEEQKAHIRERTLSPTPYNAAGVAIRPFLTQGSVAERVSIFEKCPAELRQRGASTELQDKMRQPAIAAWRAQNEVKDKAQTYGRERDGRSSTESPPASSPKSPPRRTANARPANKSALIPKFHFPYGRPESRDKVEAQLQRIQQAFNSYPGGQVPKDKFAAIAKACELPLYWKVPLFLAAGGEKTGHVTAAAFLDFWKRLLATSHDQASRFVRVLTAGQRTHLVPEDLVPLVQDVVETHPGLNFLKEAIEFHSRYVHTVIARIFYCVNRSWSGRITVAELRRSNLLKTIQLLEQEEDINQITDYFSYEHFYVIYCKFWELDKDHDLLIDKSDVARHNDHAVSSRIIDRIFSGAVTRGSARKQEKMTYMEFVWFLLSEEDKKHPTAIEYWFRCMDLDGDGYLSMYELEYFYEEQLQRMEALGIEALPFEDCLCWMLDMVQPETPGKIALSDLKQCQMSNIFFDTFFNLEKYLEHDQRDPFALQRDGEPGQTMSDWDRFAAEEYELLVAEEGAAEQDPEFLYEDDPEPGTEPLERLSITEPGRPQQPARPPPDADDDYAETDADYTYISDSAGSPVYGQAKVV
ncbi:chromatin modification-related protein eaf-1-like isoform X1 [Amphibalanus amphitrite]|uniref:chromatin modification-related protein eaf-1-like isoform X1 n=1 Tax=Amphibalanus amphitrite TaxID=1232801 RepID=UPI001C8FF052|nr:chromatin modification-related protein eaf-1-like isoform X1 [Amphibalanus amphitrite]